MDARDPHSSRSSGTGIFGNSVLRLQNPDNAQELTASQVKMAYEAALAEDQSAKDRAENQLSGDAFINAHPEILDTVPNAQLFVHEMDRMFGPGRHPINHFEAAYESLRASNFLALDQTELAKQQKVAAKQRYKTERASNVMPSEEEMYAMPIEDLRRLDAIERQKQLQLAAERGGNGF